MGTCTGVTGGPWPGGWAREGGRVHLPPNRHPPLAPKSCPFLLSLSTQWRTILKFISDEIIPPAENPPINSSALRITSKVSKGSTLLPNSIPYSQPHGLAFIAIPWARDTLTPNPLHAGSLSLPSPHQRPRVRPPEAAPGPRARHLPVCPARHYCLGLFGLFPVSLQYIVMSPTAAPGLSAFLPDLGSYSRGPQKAICR